MLLLFHLFAASPARAESPDIVVVGWIDHFTYGAINTAIGIPVGLVGMIINWIKGEKPAVRLDSTGQQVVLSTGSFNHFNYATGAIHHGDCCDAHEAGHGKQSGVLGAAFLPMVGLTYLAQGLDKGLIEDWADAWSDLGATMVDGHPLRIELDYIDDTGKVAGRIGVNFTILERNSKVHSGLKYSDDTPLAVSYQYGKIGVFLAIPTEQDVREGRGVNLPMRLDASVFEKFFSGKWPIVSGLFSLLSESEEKTLNFAVDLRGSLSQVA